MTNQQGAPEALFYADVLGRCAEVDFDHIFVPAAAVIRRLHAENERLAAMVEAQQPAPSAALKAVLAAIRAANMQLVRTGDDEFMLVTLKQATPQADSQPAPVLDMAVMQLAESVGLIGPASRVHDLHAAIQRFHDLICVNATIKAAVMAADAIRGAATSARDYPPLPMQFACTGVFPVYSADQMRAYVDADRAARAPADSVTAPAATPTAASIAWTALRDLTDPLGEAGVKIMGHVRIYAQRQYEAGLTEGRATPPAQAADSVLEDAARLLRQILAASQDGDSDTHLSVHFVSRIETITKAGGAA